MKYILKYVALILCCVSLLSLFSFSHSSSSSFSSSPSYEEEEREENKEDVVVFPETEEKEEEKKEEVFFEEEKKEDVEEDVIFSEEKEEENIAEEIVNTPKKEEKKEEEREEETVFIPIPISKIDVNDYLPCISYSGLSDTAKTVIEAMLEFMKVNDSQDYIYPPISEFTHENEIELKGFFSIYYGNFTESRNFYSRVIYQQPVEFNPYNFLVYCDTFKAADAERSRYLQIIETALSEMSEGSETKKLNQVAKWIASQYTFQSDSPDVKNITDKGIGNCTSSSTLFRMFAERLGIPCDVVVGYAAHNGEYHAWNRVLLSDGTYRYYDVNLFNSTKNEKYLNSTTEWHNRLYINRFISH